MIDWSASGPDATLAQIHAETSEARLRSPKPGSTPGNAADIVPSASPLSVSIEGPGLFVFQDGARRTYGRLGAFRMDPDGALTDPEGRAVMGFDLDELRVSTRRLRVVSVPADALATNRFTSYSIERNGTFAGHAGATDALTGIRREVVYPIARLALAIFPAPQRLAPAGAANFAKTAGSGAPLLCVPGDIHAGTLRPHSLESGISDIKDSLERLWLLRRRAQLQTAMAGVNDRCVRTALGLVK